jgi:hypothetical protein
MLEYQFFYTGCPKNGVLTVHYGVEQITVNARKMLKKFYWTYFLIWRSLNVALNRSIILKYMYEIVMTATSNRTYYLYYLCLHCIIVKKKKKKLIKIIDFFVGNIFSIFFSCTFKHPR